MILKHIQTIPCSEEAIPLHPVNILSGRASTVVSRQVNMHVIRHLLLKTLNKKGGIGTSSALATHMMNNLEGKGKGRGNFLSSPRCFSVCRE